MLKVNVRRFVQYRWQPIRFFTLSLVPQLIIASCQLAMFLKSAGVVKRVHTPTLVMIIFIFSVTGIISRIILTSRLTKDYLRSKEHTENLYCKTGMRRYRALTTYYLIRSTYISHIVKLVGVFTLLCLGVHDGLAQARIISVSTKDIFLLVCSMHTVILMVVLSMQLIWTCIDIKIMINTRSTVIQNDEGNPDGGKSNGNASIKHNIAISAMITCFILRIGGIVTDLLIDNHLVSVDLPAPQALALASRAVVLVGFFVCFSWYCSKNHNQYIAATATLETLAPIENVDSLSIAA